LSTKCVCDPRGSCNKQWLTSQQHQRSSLCNGDEVCLLRVRNLIYVAVFALQAPKCYTW
jgi:hypothetical protein